MPPEMLLRPVRMPNYDEKFCLEDGCYTLEITGWSDGQWSLDFDPVLVPLFGYDPNIDSGTGPATINFSVGEDSESSGCTDAMACNYNADAICDNGTCCYASCLTIEMTDTWGDGWNGNVWEVIASDSSIVASGTLSNGEIGIDGRRVPENMISAQQPTVFTSTRSAPLQVQITVIHYLGPQTNKSQLMVVEPMPDA